MALPAALRLAQRVRGDLDNDKGGRFRIAAAGALRYKQYYSPETNVLVTRFPHPDGIVEVDQYDRDASVNLPKLLPHVQPGLVGQTQVQDNDIRPLCGGPAKTGDGNTWAI